MTLHVYTARVSTRDPDRLDVTRKSGGKEGEPFAPSWAILRPALEGMNRVRMWAKEGNLVVALATRRTAWDAYVPAYVAEMRRSYRAHRTAWDALLARERVVLVCYCTDPEHCHRRLLAEILVKLGAIDCGELAEAA